jgi:hypothetical protein
LLQTKNSKRLSRSRFEHLIHEITDSFARIEGYVFVGVFMFFQITGMGSSLLCGQWRFLWLRLNNQLSSCSLQIFLLLGSNFHLTKHNPLPKLAAKANSHLPNQVTAVHHTTMMNPFSGRPNQFTAVHYTTLMDAFLPVP